MNKIFLVLIPSYRSFLSNQGKLKRKELPMKTKTYVLIPSYRSFLSNFEDDLNGITHDAISLNPFLQVIPF